MGDCLDDDQWAPEEIKEEDVEGDVLEEDHSGAESDEEEKQEQLREEAKRLKKKRKFEELKAKKRLKKEEEIAEETAESIAQLNPDQMLQLLDSHLPAEAMDATMDAFGNRKEFPSEIFFCPSLDPSGTTESTTKKPCPFVRALSCALPGYKKLLLKTNVNKDLNGCPILLVVCASAQRATEIIKSVSSKLIKCKIAKLFAKHFKIGEQIEMLSKEHFPIAIGTPNRLSKLIEVGALSLSSTRICLVDHTEDTKHFTITSLPEVKTDFYRLLYGPIYEHREHLKVALVKDKAVQST